MGMWATTCVRVFVYKIFLHTYIIKKILSLNFFCFPSMKEGCSSCSSDTSIEECALCFEPLKIIDATTCSNCKQRSCEACLDRWTMVQIQQKVMPSCPYCRFQLLESNEAPSTDEIERPLLGERRRRRDFLNPVGILFSMFSIMLLLVYYIPQFSEGFEVLIYVYISVFLITLFYLVTNYVLEADDDDDVEAAL